MPTSTRGEIEAPKRIVLATAVTTMLADVAKFFIMLSEYFVAMATNSPPSALMLTTIHVRL